MGEGGAAGNECPRKTAGKGPHPNPLPFRMGEGGVAGHSEKEATLGNALGFRISRFGFAFEFRNSDFGFFLCAHSVADVEELFHNAIEVALPGGGAESVVELAVKLEQLVVDF